MGKIDYSKWMPPDNWYLEQGLLPTFARGEFWAEEKIVEDGISPNGIKRVAQRKAKGSPFWQGVLCFINNYSPKRNRRDNSQLHLRFKQEERK